MLFVITENKPSNKIIEKLAPFIDTFEIVFSESFKELMDYKIVANGDYVLFASTAEAKPSKAQLKALPYGTQALTLTTDSVGEDLDLSQLFIRITSKPRIGAFLKSPEKLLYKPIFKEDEKSEIKNTEHKAETKKASKSLNQSTENKKALPEDRNQVSDKKPVKEPAPTSEAKREVSERNKKVEPSKKQERFNKDQSDKGQKSNQELQERRVPFEKRTRNPRNQNGHGQNQNIQNQKQNGERPKNKKDNFRNGAVKPTQGKPVQEQPHDVKSDNNQVLKPLEFELPVLSVPDVEPKLEPKEVVNKPVEASPFSFVEPEVQTNQQPAGELPNSPFVVGASNPFELGNLGTVGDSAKQVVDAVNNQEDYTSTFETLMAKMGG
mgnify:FL=1